MNEPGVTRSQSQSTILRRLLLVRHGLPDYRGGKAGDEPPGPPLSPIGFDQARQAAEVVASYEPSAIHSSPLARSTQTAACFAGDLALDVVVDSDLKEWHRTEDLYRFTERHVRWLRRWLATGERCAVMVGHASGVLAVLRAALHLPHFGWWVPGRPDRPQLATCDRFEVSMASVFELTFEATAITARCLFHPRPRIMQVRKGRCMARFPRPIPGENKLIRRPNFTRLIGFDPPEVVRDSGAPCSKIDHCLLPNTVNGPDDYPRARTPLRR